MSHETYLLAWQMYAATAALAFVCVWSATKWRWSLISWLLRVNLLVLLALPYRIAENSELLAPAWTKLLITSVFTGMGDPKPVAQSLMSLFEAASIATLITYVIWLVVRRTFKRIDKHTKLSQRVKVVSSKWANFADAPTPAAVHTRGLIHRVRRRRFD